jgi:hypothetical protein
VTLRLVTAAKLKIALGRMLDSRGRGRILKLAELMLFEVKISKPPAGRAAFRSNESAAAGVCWKLSLISKDSVYTCTSGTSH